jgi:hypothetical protein
METPVLLKIATLPEYTDRSNESRDIESVSQGNFCGSAIFIFTEALTHKFGFYAIFSVIGARAEKFWMLIDYLY